MNYVTGTGQTIFNVHQPYQCQGPWCVIHNPAPGPWTAWPTHWLPRQGSDAFHGFMVRICPCGFLHPCVEDNLPTAVLPHHADCPCQCPCGPEHIATAWNTDRDAFRHPVEGPGVARARAILAVTNEPLPGGDEVDADRYFDGPLPVDYDGAPALLRGDLTLEQQFVADQNAAAAEDALAVLVHLMMGAVITDGGDHPGRHVVSADWLAAMQNLSGTQAKGLLQYACWHLAEVYLVKMEGDGTLEQMYGIKLGEGWGSDDHE